MGLISSTLVYMMKFYFLLLPGWLCYEEVYFYKTINLTPVVG